MATYHVRGRHVDARADEAVLVQLHGVASRDFLQFVHRVLFRVDCDAAFCASKRDVDHCALEGHERGQRFDLLQIDGVGVTDAALAWCAVVAVLRPICADDLDAAVISQDRKRDAQHRVARDHLAHHARAQARVFGRAFKVELHHVEESRLVVWRGRV